MQVVHKKWEIHLKGSTLKDNRLLKNALLLTDKPDRLYGQIQAYVASVPGFLEARATVKCDAKPR